MAIDNLVLDDGQMDKLRTAFSDFDKLHTITDIVLLGEDGACRRIIMGEDIHGY